MDQVHCEPKRTLIVAGFIWVVALLVACSSITPQNTIAPAPSPAATPAFGQPFLVSSALLSPGDLTFNENYPATGWHRCDDYSVDRNLERYRAAYRVTGSAAAIWEYGSGCSGADQKARLDEYAWLLSSEGAASELSGALTASSALDQVTPSPGNQVRRFGRDSVVARTLVVESSDGKRLYAAEIIGQAGSAVAHLRMTTETELTDENYLELVQLCLDRLRTGQRAR